MRTRRRIALAAGAVACAAACAGVALAAFSATTTNAGSSFSAATSFANGALLLASGSYTGNGTDNRAITGLGFHPDLVIVKADAAQVGVARTSTMTGDAAKPITGTTALAANLIQSLDANGFTVGTQARVNQNGTTYHWTAVRASVGTLAVGAYTGTGAALSVSGVGFSPEYAMIFPDAAAQSLQRAVGMARSFNFDNDTGSTTAVTSLDADGFTLGTSTDVNSNGAEYHYVAWNDAPGTVRVGTFTGTGTAQSVANVGFQPGYVVVRANDTATGRRAYHRPGSLAGTASARFGALANDAATGITALQADGFDVGTSTDVNANGVANAFLAARSNAPATGCAAPGTQTVTANADTWVDQAAPTSANGSDVDLLVRSRNGSRNRRILVRFPLPALPAGCTVVNARLRLYVTNQAADRTIEAYRAAAAWTEATVTWNTQPAAAGTAATSVSPSAANLWLEWSVARQVQAMYSSSNTGFLLRDSVEDATSNQQQTASSREDAPNDPELIVTFG
jgi:hypothetical protein